MGSVLFCLVWMFVLSVASPRGGHGAVKYISFFFCSLFYFVFVFSLYRSGWIWIVMRLVCRVSRPQRCLLFLFQYLVQFAVGCLHRSDYRACVSRGRQDRLGHKVLFTLCPSLGLPVGQIPTY